MAGVALLGAGIFAKEEHLPAIKATPNLNLLAVYSRSQASAEALAGESGCDPAVYYDNPNTAGKSLGDLLQRKDISAVVIGLPITKQPEIIRKALAAGKHVLSEKPIAPDVATAKSVLAFYASLPAPHPIWAVAENFRFFEPLHYAASKVKEIGGQLTTFHLAMNAFITDDDQFFNTPWRKVPEYQGGFLLDGGVHFIAGLRLLLGAAGEHVQQLTCFSALLEKKLLPVDTVHSVAATRNGVSGLVSISFGTEFKSGLEIGIVTTKGAVTWDPSQVKTVRRGNDGKLAEESKTYGRNSGVVAEVAAFAKSLPTGRVDSLQSPEEALKDLEFLEALLESGQSGASVKTLS